MLDLLTVKRRASRQIFDLQGRLRAQIVTYEGMSVCNVSQNV